MISISTDNVQASERAEFWADLVTRCITPMRIEPSGNEALAGTVEVRKLGDLGLARVTGCGMRAAHGRAQIARSHISLYAAGVHVQGDARLGRRGEEIALQPGDIFITDSRQQFTFDLEQPWRHLVITLPATWMDGRVTRPELLSGAVMRDRPLARLWANCLASGFTLADGLSDAAAALFARHAVDLLAQVIEEANCLHPTSSEARNAAFYLRACNVIALKFGDPNLTPALIARELHLSTRTLSRIFAAREETVMRRVFNERVRQAAILLTKQQGAGLSVTEIAFACGFSDASHFGRAFAERMHMTPSQWRARHR